MSRKIAFLIALSIGLAAPMVRAQPSLSHALPGALRPGQTTEITLHGGKLDGELRFWSSFSARFELGPSEAGKKDLASRSCKVTLDAQAPVGVGGLVVGNAAGASDVLLLMIDDLPSVTDNGQNHAAGSAQAVTLPTAVDGVCDGSVLDYYRFAGKKGQRISVEVVAARAGSSMDAVVRLLDAKERELLLVDDDPSYGADSRFGYTLPEDGDYLIEIRDNQFRAGGRYRLRMGDFPLVSAPYPLGGRFGSTMRFQFTGPAADAAAPVFLRLPDELASGSLPISARLPSGKSSAMATIVTSVLPDIVETEPNNDAKQATLTSVPCAVNGTFREPGDCDYYQFAATKGQSILFRAVARSMGSPAYLAMRLYGADGKQIAESAVNDAEETSLSYAFPADGMYCLKVEDLLSRGGPEYGYRVEAQSNEGFSLTLKNDKDTKTRFLAPGKNGAFALTVQIARRGYDGPVQLSLVSASPLGAGAASGASAWKLHNGLVPAKVNEQRVVVEVPAGAEAGALEALRLTGEAAIQGRVLTSSMQTTPTLRARLPQLLFPPGWLDGLLVASVGAEAPPLFGISSSASPVEFARGSGQAQFNVTLERKEKDFKDAISLLVAGLPGGFTAAVKPDKDTYQVTITGPKDAPVGQHPVTLVAYGEFKGAGQVIQLDLPVVIKD